MNKIMLVSDYDDTLTNEKDKIKINLKYIKKFMKNNIFVIATGRSYISIKQRLKIDMQGLTPDYLITNHGASIINNNNEVIHTNIIEKEVVNKILELINKEKTHKINFYGSKKFNGNINKIMLVFKNIEEAINVFNKIKNTDLVTTYLINRKGKLPKVEIISKDINKAKAIKFLEKLENPSKVEVIGDGPQDIEMIKEYSGNCVVNSDVEVKEISKKQYKYVYELIKELQEN